MNLQLLAASIEEMPFIVEVYNSVIPGKEVTADLEPISIEDWMPWFQKHDDHLRPIWILWSDRRRCGWMSFTDYKSRPAYDATAEISIYLDDKCRGMGLGSKFIERGLKEIKRRGLKRVLAVIYASNIVSVNIFKRQGFQEWGFLPGVCIVEDIAKDVVILGKKLGS